MSNEEGLECLFCCLLRMKAQGLPKDFAWALDGCQFQIPAMTAGYPARRHQAAYTSFPSIKAWR